MLPWPNRQPEVLALSICRRRMRSGKGADSRPHVLEALTMFRVTFCLMSPQVPTRVGTA